MTKKTVYDPWDAYRAFVVKEADENEWSGQKRLAALAWVCAWAKARNRNASYTPLKARTAVIKFDQWYSRNTEDIMEAVSTTRRASDHPIFEGVHVAKGDLDTSDTVDLVFTTLGEAFDFRDDLRASDTGFVPVDPMVTDSEVDRAIRLTIERK